MLFHGLRGEGINKGVVANIAAKQQGHTVGAIGDSITSTALSTSATTLHWTLKGFLTWLRHLTNQSLSVLPTNVYATSGYKVSDIIAAGYHTSAAAANLDIVIVHAGTNDVATVGSSTTTAGLQVIYENLLASGAIVVAVPVLPQASASSTARLRRAAINLWIREYCRSHKRMILADPRPQITDATSSTGEPVSGMLYDGLHPNAKGAYYIAQAIIASLTNYILPFDGRFSDVNDVYDATNNPYGNLLTNGMLNGTGGAVSGTGRSGTVADSWTFANATSIGSVGTLAAVASKVARTDGETGYWQQFAYTGTPGALFTDYFRNTTAVSAGYTAGVDYVYMTADYEVDASSAGLLQVGGYAFSAGAATNPSRLDPVYDTSADVYPPVAIAGVVKTEPFLIPASATSISGYIAISHKASVAASSTIRVGKIELRKVI